MLECAGAQILTCHGRTREQRGHNSGLADWEKIRAVKEAVSVPVFANGNILFHSDIEKCLKATGADAVMSAEGQLYNVALFAPAQSSSSSRSPPTFDTGLHLPHADLALEYLSIIEGLQTKTPLSAVKGHLFKLMRPGLARETDLREKLGRIRSNGSIDAYIEIAEEMKQRMDRDAAAAECLTVEELVNVDPVTGLKLLPHWLAQPYFRPPLPISTEKTIDRDTAFKAARSEDTVKGGLTVAGKRVHSDRTPDGEEPPDDAKRTKFALVSMLE